MPNIKTAIKRVKINSKKAAANKSIRSEVRTIEKKAKAAIANNSEDVKELVDLAIKKIDKSAGKGLMHKNKADRKKSQLTRALNSLQ